MFSIVLPCYNEADNLDNLFNKIINFKSNNFQFILVNNGSTDETGLKIKNFQCNKDIVKVDIKKNRGLGFGIIKGLICASNEFIGYMHVHNFEDFDELLLLENIVKNKKEKFLFIKGLRYGNRSKIDLFFSYNLNIFTSILLLKKMWDITAQPTIFHKNLLTKSKKIPHDFKIDLYLYFSAIKFKYKIIRFKFKFKKRKFGQSSWNKGLLSQIRTSTQYIIYIFRLSFKND